MATHSIWSDKWDDSPIGNLLVSIPNLANDEVHVRVKATGNFPEASNRWTVYEVEPNDLRDFLAGFTIIPQGAGNHISREVGIKLPINAGFVHLEFDRAPVGELETDGTYTLGSDRGTYEDPRLAAILRKVNYSKHEWVNEETHRLISGGRYALVMDFEGYTTLFKEAIPLSFIRGLQAFQTLAHKCHTHLAKIPRKYRR